MKSLPHGYTNETERLGDRVSKRYIGNDAERRHRVEAECLRRLQGRLAVPSLLAESSPAELTMSFIEGRHGQDLIDAGLAPLVLGLCGELLVQLQDIAQDVLEPNPGSGEVLVHGDFGPQNILIDVEDQRVTALLDREFAHAGMRIEDLAWAERIVRMHHPEHSEHLISLFDGYGCARSGPDVKNK